MKLKQCMKRISTIILAATMIVVALPNQPVVKADEDDFPDEILFPVSILDFPADNLLFECPMSWMENYNSNLDLTSEAIAGVNNDGTKGKALVADTLESDPKSIYYRLPVYKEKTVDYIAKRVQATMKGATSGNLAFNRQYVNHDINPICASNYIRRDGWKTLDASDEFYETDYNANKYGIYYYSKLGGKAASTGSAYCLKENYVGYIGGTPDVAAADQGTVTFKYNNTLAAGTYTMRIYYMTEDPRRFSIKVNDGAAFNTDYLDNDSWDNPKDKPYNVKVYLKAGVNTITFGGDGTDYAPNLDRIEIGTVQTVDDIVIQAEDGNIWGNNTKYANYVSIGHWNSDAYWDFSVAKTGTYNIEVYYRRNEEQWFQFKVYSPPFYQEKITSKPRYAKNTDMSKNPVLYTGVQLTEGNNRIAIDNWANLDIDKIVISYSPVMSGDFALGNYKDSKEKYNIDRDGNKISDYGFYDMTTCYDYAYFITANLYKYHPSINSAYGNYNNLVFHKVVQGTKTYYEFMADQIHNESISNDNYVEKIENVYKGLKYDDEELKKAEKKADLDRYASVSKGAGRLIYNPDTRSIRNACDAEGNYVGPKGNEFETNSGFMFVCDGDDFNKDSVNNPAGKGVKKYPSVDPPKNGDDGKSHNFNYTIRTHSRFVYKRGYAQKFFFSGDDDVYVFVNGHLLVDLGGQHQQEDGSFNLDDLAEDPKYGLEPNKAVDFDFFYMERHSTSSNFWGKMSFKLKNDEVELQWPDEFGYLKETSIPYGYTVDLNYKFSSMRELTTNKDITFSDDLGDYIGKDDFKLADEVKVGPYKYFKTDPSTGAYLLDDDGNRIVETDNTRNAMVVTVKRAQADDTYIEQITPFFFADPKNFTETEINSVKKFFEELSLEQGDSVEISGVVYDTALRKFSDFDKTDKPTVNRITFNTYVDYMAYMTMGGTNSIEDTVPIKSQVRDSCEVKVVIGALVVSCKVEGLDDETYQKKEDLSAYGDLKLRRLDTEDDESTTDVDERIVYENTKFNLIKGGSTIVFNVDDPDDPRLKPYEPYIRKDPIPKGTYELNLDIKQLTGYDLYAEVWVDGEKKVVVERTRDRADWDDLDKDHGYKVTSFDESEYDSGSFSLEKIAIKVEPHINHTTGLWDYPVVEYKLKAFRKLNPLKDLT